MLIICGHQRHTAKRPRSIREYYYDKLLHVKTGESKNVAYPDSPYHYPYEPTPYDALDTLFTNYSIKAGSQVVDFGCGKGRLNFYLHYFQELAVKGIEMDQDLLKGASDNLRSYLHHTKNQQQPIEFINCLAEEYRIVPEDTYFYFFNPFSIQIFRKVVDHILVSVAETDRDAELILYYPDEKYIDFLESETMFTLKQEIIVPGLYDWDLDERFLVYDLI